MSNSYNEFKNKYIDITMVCTKNIGKYNYTLLGIITIFICMKIFQRDYSATFLERPNRFIIKADLDGEVVTCHCPNTGRMGELLLPSVRLILEKSKNPKRKTPYTVVAVYKEELIVPITSARANDVTKELIIPKLFSGTEVRSEVTYGDSRFDFMLTKDEEKTFIEVKSCTLFDGDDAIFPDAPTTRGVKHMKELLEATKEGYKAAVILVVFNPDSKRFYPNHITDPNFAKTMKEISSRVKIFPYKVSVDEEGSVSIPESPLLPLEFLC